MDENEVTGKMQQNIKQIQKNGWYKLKWEKNGAHTHTQTPNRMNRLVINENSY